MEKLIAFLQELNELTNRTGVVIETFGDPNYDPLVANKEDASKYDRYTIGEKLYFSHDGDTYVARTGNPYDGPVVFPLNYIDE